MVLFLLFCPGYLTKQSQISFRDSRFIRTENPYRGTALIYHIVRHRPFGGGLSNWLQKRADEYEKKHRGSFITVEGISEDTFQERMEHGRNADAYSFFSGSLYPDLLMPFEFDGPLLRSGLFLTDRSVPYCCSGYVKLIRNPDKAKPKTYYVNDVIAARMNAGESFIQEEQADILYLDMRRAGDLIRYKDGFANAVIEPVDSFTDAVCWFGIDRRTDSKKQELLESFFLWILEEEQQSKLNGLGLLSVRADMHNQAPDSSLKAVFKQYDTVETVDPFLWYSEYDALFTDAVLSRKGDTDAKLRFQKRLKELIR